VSIGEGEYIKI